VIEAIDRGTEIIGRACSWLAGVMVAATFLVVVLRYGFDIGTIALQESVTYLHGMLFLFGLGFTLKHDGHVRVDLLYGHMTKRQQAWTNLVGHLVCLIPTCIVIVWVSWRYVANSWTILEGSPEVGGIPAVFLLKTTIPAGAALLAVQGLAEVARCIASLKAKRG